MLRNLITFLLLIPGYFASTATPLPTVETQYGVIAGENKEHYSSYKSIPYAEPPVGDLRFEPPLPLQTNWTGVWNATRTASMCLQWDTFSSKHGNPLVGSEDCLYLNVFVPHRDATDKSSETALLPVLVFIHGGGFMWGSSDFYGEEYIMRNGEIILVTLNYRLGPFGFLSTEDDEIVGNMGLKDQTLALKWVHDNIVNFGGDKTKVLLAGWSAGASSVNYHMVSEFTPENWFSSAASFSGSALCPCHAIYSGEALKKSKQLAAYVNCTEEQLASTKGIKTCLKSQKAEVIASQIAKFFKYGSHPFAIFGPVIEKAENAQSFLTDQVQHIIRAGKAKLKPWLISYNAQDMGFGTATFLKKGKSGQELIYELNERWSELAPMLLFFDPTLSKEEQELQAAKMKQEFFGEQPIGLENYEKLEELYNSELCVKPMRKLAALQANYTKGSAVYSYIYDNPPPYGLGQYIAERNDWKFGTLHGDDLFLIFKTAIRERHPFREDEKLISKNLINMLVQLVKTGIPIYDQTPIVAQPDNGFVYMQITKDGRELVGEWKFTIG